MPCNTCNAPYPVENFAERHILCRQCKNLCASHGTLQKAGAAPQHPVRSLRKRGAMIASPARQVRNTKLHLSRPVLPMHVPVPPLPCQSAPLPARPAPAWWSMHGIRHTALHKTHSREADLQVRSQALPRGAGPCAAARDNTSPAPACQGAHTKSSWPGCAKRSHLAFPCKAPCSTDTQPQLALGTCPQILQLPCGTCAAGGTDGGRRPGG